MADGRTRLRGYSPYDPVDVPSALLPALAAFDGRPTAAVRAEVTRAHGIALDAPLLRQLCDFEILEPAQPSPKDSP
jgi:hypothetical protein